MAWVYLLVAGALEVAATAVFRFSGGLTSSRLGSTASSFIAGLSLFCLNRSLEGVRLGTAYAVRTGIGAAGAAMLGAWAFGEAAPRRIFVGLKFVSA